MLCELSSSQPVMCYILISVPADKRGGKWEKEEFFGNRVLKLISNLLPVAEGLGTVQLTQFISSFDHIGLLALLVDTSTFNVSRESCWGSCNPSTIHDQSQDKLSTRARIMPLLVLLLLLLLLSFSRITVPTCAKSRRHMAPNLARFASNLSRAELESLGPR